jgi:hypothetical protein
VTCRELEDLLIPYAKGAAIPPGAAAHIAACERCRTLAGALGESDDAVPPSLEQLQRIKAETMADLKPVGPLAPTGVLWLALLLIAAAAAAGGVLELGTAGWRALGPLTRIAVFTALAAGCGLLGLSLARQVVPGSRVLFPTPLFVIAVLGIMASIFATLFHPHREPTFIATGLVCLRIGLECAAPVAILSWLVLRRGEFLNPVAAGAMMGALAGLSGLVLLEIFCPNLNKYHILVWHLGAALLSTCAGTAVGIVAEYRRGYPQ